MRARKRKAESRSLAVAPALDEFEPDDAEQVGDPQADQQLAKRCVQGEVLAWEELYGRFHDPLCIAIRGMLGSGGADLSRIDEIAARVWYALVRDDGELLEPLPTARHTRLAGFLRARPGSKSCVTSAEYRRRTQESACPCPTGGGTAVSDWQVSAMIEDFASTLTAGEQEFLEEHLLGQPEEGERKVSQASVWQRCHRIREKLKAFFGGNA